MNHTPDCIKYTERINQQRQDYLYLWPNYCRKCNGYGTTTWYENQAPIGSGYVWNEQFIEVCPQCIDKGICPRCNKLLYVSLRDVFLHYVMEVEDYIYDWFKTRYRKHSFGIAVKPWTKDNWKYKLYYKIEKFIRRRFNKLIHPMLKKREMQEVFTNDNYQCPFCKFKLGDVGIVELDYCGCEGE